MSVELDDAVENYRSLLREEAVASDKFLGLEQQADEAERALLSTRAARQSALEAVLRLVGDPDS